MQRKGIRVVIDIASFLLLAPLLLLGLLLATLHGVLVVRPDLIDDMLIVVLLCPFLSSWQECDDLGVLVSVGPVGRRITVVVTYVQVVFLMNEPPHKVDMTLACSDVKAGEATRVLDLSVTTLQEQLGNHVTHVPLCSEMHRSVTSNSV